MGEYAAVVTAVAAVVGTAVSTYAAYSSAEAQSSANKYQSKVARNNALASQYAAEAKARQERKRDKLILSRQRAVFGASGLDPGEGTPLLTMADSARQAELNALNIEWSGRLQSDNFSAESSLRRFEAGAVKEAGYLRAGSSLLSGVSSYAGSRSAASQNPAPYGYS